MRTRDSQPVRDGARLCSPNELLRLALAMHPSLSQAPFQDATFPPSRLISVQPLAVSHFNLQNPNRALRCFYYLKHELTSLVLIFE